MSWLRLSQPLSDGPVVQDGPAAGPGLCPCIMHQQLRQSFCVWEPSGVGAWPPTGSCLPGTGCPEGGMVGVLRTGEELCGGASEGRDPRRHGHHCRPSRLNLTAGSRHSGKWALHLPGLPGQHRTHCLVIIRGSLANPASSYPVIPRAPVMWPECPKHQEPRPMPTSLIRVVRRSVTSPGWEPLGECRQDLLLCSLSLGGVVRDNHTVDVCVMRKGFQAFAMAPFLRQWLWLRLRGASAGSWRAFAPGCPLPDGRQTSPRRRVGEAAIYRAPPVGQTCLEVDTRAHSLPQQHCPRIPFLPSVLEEPFTHSPALWCSHWVLPWIA